MNESLPIITAQTHTPEYLLHKYWARKPHNVISWFLHSLVPTGGTVLDPFCGSGVVLREAQKAGFLSVGLDINPIAVLNTKVLTNPPDTDQFSFVVRKILSEAEDKIKESYSLPNKKTIKYLVHISKAQCPSCKEWILSSQCSKKGVKYFCPLCGSSLKFNMSAFSGSKISAACVENEKALETNLEFLKLQETNSASPLFDVSTESYNFPLVENRRILIYPGMETKDLFTVRNFNILCHFAAEFEKIQEKSLRHAAMLFLTASVAQCSRLIPCRNNLSTGGPAWSVPGFWVPSKHLETNPLIHLYARLNKFEKGLARLNHPPAAIHPVIQNTDCLNYLKNNPVKADLIFLDPPYGDNVPYTEFSAMWNSFLKIQPDLELDFSVSDRMARESSWTRYRDKLNQLLSMAPQILNPLGHLLITFNNNDLKAWEALLKALQTNHFQCSYVTYVIPAVISSKAQFSPGGSYISDIYSVYSYVPHAAPSFSLECVTSALIKCAAVRDYQIAKNLALRTIMIEWIQNNISCSLLQEIPNLLSSLFQVKKEICEYTGPKDKTFVPLKISTRLYAKKLLENGPCNWNDLYRNTASEFLEYGFLDPNELRSYLEGHVIFSKDRCMAYKE